MNKEFVRKYFRQYPDRSVFYFTSDSHGGMHAFDSEESAIVGKNSLTRDCKYLIVDILKFTREQYLNDFADLSADRHDLSTENVGVAQPTPQPPAQLKTETGIHETELGKTTSRKSTHSGNPDSDTITTTTTITKKITQTKTITKTPTATTIVTTTETITTTPKKTTTVTATQTKTVVIKKEAALSHTPLRHAADINPPSLQIAIGMEQGSGMRKNPIRETPQNEEKRIPATPFNNQITIPTSSGTVGDLSASFVTSVFNSPNHNFFPIRQTQIENNCTFIDNINAHNKRNTYFVPFLQYHCAYLHPDSYRDKRTSSIA